MKLDELKINMASLLRADLGQDFDPERFDVSFADPQFGDLATNVAMVYAKELAERPRDLAAKMVESFRGGLAGVAKVEIAGPGFINIVLTDEALGDWLVSGRGAKGGLLRGQTIVTEYSDPNPFKVLHAGHLYTTVVGDVISRLQEAAGAKVHRVNYGGDVGLHVGKAMWGIVRHLGGEKPELLAKVPEDERPSWLSERYVEGNEAYEQSEQAKGEIVECNKRVYRLHEEGDRESAFARIYWTCREWSYEGFKALYERLGVVPFERYLPESEVTPEGIRLVERGLKEGILERSQGAVIFKGELHGLHTRVFLTAAALPTYEAKDLGLAATKWRDYKFDRSVIITGNDIADYMKVVLTVLSHFYPEVVPRSAHLTHGMVKLPGGVKMSSRKGNTLLAGDILDAAGEANRAATGRDDWEVVVGAVKYAFLKQRIGGDIIYDPNESVSLDGNSGPYLQYAHARACSILAKAEGGGAMKLERLEPGERTLARKLLEYPGVIERATLELMPHYICTYLYELAQVFNRFYEANRVIGDEREDVRLGLVRLYAGALRDGLELLGIQAPERL